MADIWHTYMSKSDGALGLAFFVALEGDQVVGSVGIQKCGYPQEGENHIHADVYENTKRAEVCELVRMSVHKSYRGRKIGQKLCSQVESWALESGTMKKIAVSTLSAMVPARRLYESVGYSFRIETEIPMTEILGEGEWDITKVAHYIKAL